MTTLSVHGYGAPRTAERKVQLLEPRPGRRLSVDDAAVLSWPETSGRPITWQASPMGTHHSLSGAFWGLLFAHLCLIPLSYAEPPRVTLDQSDDALAPLGLTAADLATIRALLAPGTSAVFAVHRDEDLGVLSATLDEGAAPGAAIVLDPIQSRRLYAGFAEHHDST